MPSLDHFDVCPKSGHALLTIEVLAGLPAGVGQIASRLQKRLKF